MKVKIKGKGFGKNKIDWNKPRLLELYGCLVLTDGQHTKDMFSATVITHKRIRTGTHSDMYSKNLWRPFDGKVVLSN